MFYQKRKTSVSGNIFNIHCNWAFIKDQKDPSIIYRGDRVFIYVNQRPVNYIRSDLKDLVSLAKNRLREILGLADDGQKSLMQRQLLVINMENPFRKFCKEDAILIH